MVDVDVGGEGGGMHRPVHDISRVSVSTAEQGMEPSVKRRRSSPPPSTPAYLDSLHSSRRPIDDDAEDDVDDEEDADSDDAHP